MSIIVTGSLVSPSIVILGLPPATIVAHEDTEATRIAATAAFFKNSFIR